MRMDRAGDISSKNVKLLRKQDGIVLKPTLSYAEKSKSVAERLI